MRYLIVLSALVVGSLRPRRRGGRLGDGRLRPLADGARPGETWTREITVLHHGETPTRRRGAGRDDPNGARGKASLHRARADARSACTRPPWYFPLSGDVAYVIDNGVAATGTVGQYVPVTIGSPAGAPSSFPLAPVLVVLGAVALAAAAAFGVVRQRRLTPAS